MGEARVASDLGGDAGAPPGLVLLLPRRVRLTIFAVKSTIEP